MIDPLTSSLLLRQTQSADLEAPSLDRSFGLQDVASTDTETPNFKDVLSQLIGDVDSAQQQADVSLKKMAAGEDNVSIQDVVMKMEQADLSFELMKGIRDKLLTAYKEIIKGQA